MIYITFVFFFAVFSHLNVFGLECGTDEIEDSCTSNCISDFCPTSEVFRSCPNPYPCPTPNPRCKCRFNYRRAANGSCISTRDCEPFACTRPNEVYTPCPPLCPSDDCSMSAFNGECPPLFGKILIVLECTPVCRCRAGYYRDHTRLCIPAAQCATDGGGGGGAARLGILNDK